MSIGRGAASWTPNWHNTEARRCSVLQCRVSTSTSAWRLASNWTTLISNYRRMWIYRRMLRVSWTEHRTDDSILTELGTTRQLLGFVVRRKLSFFGHTIRDGGCELVKCMIQGKVSGKRRRGRPKTSYSSNITKWTSVSTERITRETRDRAGWRRLIRCAARAADHHSWWDRERRRLANNSANGRARQTPISIGVFTTHFPACAKVVYAMCYETTTTPSG